MKANSIKVKECLRVYWIKHFIFCTSLFIFSLLFCSCKEEVTEAVPLTKEIKLGAIFDLSGSLSESGRGGKAAVELAIEKLNERYQAIGSPVRFSCEFADSKLDTSLALAAAKDMFSKGIRILVGGPNPSAETKAIKNYVNENKIVVLNCFSTAPSLSVPDDYIFRLITDDNSQAQAILKMLQFKNIKVIIPIYRTDTYGTGLYEALKQKYLAQGGDVYQGVSYSPTSAAYQDIINQAANQVNNARATYGANEVAVILISYQDASNFLNAASGVPVLRTVSWFGCDANAQRVTMTNDSVAAEFAATVKFLAPKMGIGTASYLPQIANDISILIFNKTGLTPNVYALSTYDAVKIIAQAYNFVQQYDAEKIRDVLPHICAAYNYMGISRKLNSAGDLESANYIFWTVNPVSGGYGWESYATYLSEGDYIQIKN